MGRRRFSRPRAVTAVLAVALFGALASGCGDTGGAGTAPRASVTAPTAASGSPASDAELCTGLIVHWARKALRSSTYGDYQSMGLSNGQYAILRDVVDAARKAKKRQGTTAADRLIRHRARTACAGRYRDGAPRGGPWQ